MAKVKFFRGLSTAYQGGVDQAHYNGIYFATDNSTILMNGKTYGVDPVKIEELETALASSIKAIGVSYTASSATLTLTKNDESTVEVALAVATADNAGLLSAEDKAKLDGLNDELQASLVYDSAMDDSLATVSALGGIPAGTTAGSLKTKTISQVLDDLLFPTIQPSYVAPSASLSLKSTSTTPTVQEVGATGASVPTAASFNTSFNDGAIKIGNTEKQNRSGAFESGFIYVNGNASNTTLPTTIAEGATTYKYRASYAAGPTPLDSKGNPATNGSALAAGSVDSDAVTINGVYPYYANSSSNASFTKLGLTTNSSLSALKFVAEGPNKHAFKLPAKYTLTKVELLNTLSGKYENFGTDKWTVTTEDITVQGNAVSYKVYTRNDAGFNGESTFNITFSK